MNLVRIWGLEKITLSPFYFNSLRLKYALIALKKIKGKVLEIGGGAGAFSRTIKFYRNDLEIICTDYDGSLISIARKNDNLNTYQKADATKLPFSGKNFDAIISFDVVEHIENPLGVFLEAKRVLKPKGVLHFAIPLEGSPFTIHGLMNKLGLKPKQIYAGHINHFTKNEVVELLNESGFNHIKYIYSGHLTYQAADFFYFFFLFLFHKKPKNTMEGAIENLPMGIKKRILTLIRGAMSLVFYTESFIFKRLPGQIGHFTAVKK